MLGGRYYPMGVFTPVYPNTSNFPYPKNIIWNNYLIKSQNIDDGSSQKKLKHHILRC